MTQPSQPKEKAKRKSENLSDLLSDSFSDRSELEGEPVKWSAHSERRQGAGNYGEKTPKSYSNSRGKELPIGQRGCGHEIPKLLNRNSS